MARSYLICLSAQLSSGLAGNGRFLSYHTVKHSSVTESMCKRTFLSRTDLGSNLSSKERCIGCCTTLWRSLKIIDLTSTGVEYFHFRCAQENDAAIRMTGAIVMSLVYGHDARKHDDRLLEVASKGSKTIECVGPVGAHIVDLLPFCESKSIVNQQSFRD